MEHSAKDNVKKIAGILSKILTILAFVFIVFKLARMNADYSLLTHLPLAITAVIISSFVSIANVMLRAAAWRNNLGVFAEQPPDREEVFRIYTKANLGKYLPGNVMHFVERNLYAAETGLGQLEAASSTVLEIIGQCLAALILGSLLSFSYIARFFRQYVSFRYIPAAVILCAAAVIVFAVCIKKSAKIRFLAGKLKSPGFVITFFKNLGLYILDMLILGAILTVFVMLLGNRVLSVSETVLLVSENTVAWLIGFVVPGAPGGIGIREAVLQIMSEGTFFSELILVAAILQRISTIFGDVLAYIIFRGHKNVRQGN